MNKVIFAVWCLMALMSSVVLGAPEGRNDAAQGIVERDGNGFIKVMRMHTEFGSCWAEIEYPPKGSPVIYVLLSTPEFAKHVGMLEVKSASKARLRNERLLREKFKQAMDRLCLPLILPGGALT